MLKRLFFARRLFFIVFLFFFVIDVRATGEVNNPEQEEKQYFLREKILNAGYHADDFIKFLEYKRGKEGINLNNWTMDELKQVVNEFIAINKVRSAQKELGGNEQKEINEEIPKNNNFDGLNNNILQINNENNNGIKDEKNNPNKGNLFEGNPNLLMRNKFGHGPNLSINDQPSLKSPLYDLSENEIARGVFDFYRHVGKFLTSLVWSVVNSYCGFEQLVMNDWYCFKYAMCSGYRLQPRFMRSRVWIDMNFNFLEGIVGFLIRFFLFNPSYNMYENIFDIFNICIDIKVYNNLYFAVNIVGIVRSFVLLSILRDKFINPFLRYEIGV